MKIGMLSDTFLPVYGGAEIHVLELSRALRKLGHDVEICTATAGAPSEDGFQIVRIPGLAGGGKRAIVYASIALPRLARYVRHVDLIHCHDSFLMAALGSVLGRTLGVPTVVTLHGLGTLDSSVGRSFLRRFYRSVSLRLASQVIATSDEMRDVACRYTSKEKVVVIPNGVDTDKFRPPQSFSNPGGALIILAMRRLAPKNGVQYLVEAAPYVIQQIQNVQFWVAGADKLESYLRKRVIELGVSSYFRFLGIVPHEKTREYYAQADIVVFASSAESTSLACLEAMAMQKAVVASALAPYRQMLGQNERGVLVKLFDREYSDYNAPLTLPDDRIRLLAEAIVKLAKDDARRLSLGRKARAFVINHYDWSSIANRVISVYAATGVRQ